MRFVSILILMIRGNFELDAGGGVMLVLRVRKRKLPINAIWHNRVLPIAQESNVCDRVSAILRH
jgi:hypothetical protein